MGAAYIRVSAKIYGIQYTFLNIYLLHDFNTSLNIDSLIGSKLPKIESTCENQVRKCTS